MLNSLNFTFDYSFITKLFFKEIINIFQKTVLTIIFFHFLVDIWGKEGQGLTRFSGEYDEIFLNLWNLEDFI